MLGSMYRENYRRLPSNCRYLPAHLGILGILGIDATRETTMVTVDGAARVHSYNNLHNEDHKNIKKKSQIDTRA